MAGSGGKGGGHGARSASAKGTLITSAQACAMLDVKAATLYSYVSRGLVRCLTPERGRARMYVADDVTRLAVRSAARRGHGPVAAGALRWGEPVLESSITSVAGGVLAYRGRRVDALVTGGAGYEDVADLLWQRSGPWPTERPARVTRARGAPIWRMAVALPALALADDARWARGENDEIAAARRTVRALAASLGDGRVRAGNVAEIAAQALGLGPAARRPIDVALVALADHELNASTFAARIAAGAGADLYACLGAALYTLTGPRHGGMCDQLERFVDQLPATGVRAAIARRMRRGDELPGCFGHPLYPDGDPRLPIVQAAARDLRPRGAAARRVALFDALTDAVAEQGGLRPSVDLALCSLAAALEAPPGTASGLFALGRTAGWVAHILEQRRSSTMLRPRARYVGPPVTG